MNRSISLFFLAVMFFSFVFTVYSDNIIVSNNKYDLKYITDSKSLSTSSSSFDLSIIPTKPPEYFVLNATIPINVVFLGFDESKINLTQINSSLTHWYAPVINSNLSFAGANYTFELEYYLSNSTNLESDFINYLATIATWNSPPFDLQTYDSLATGAFFIPAQETVTWLDNNINNYFGNINNSYTLYLIDTYTWDYITNYYYYTIDLPDPDTGLASDESLTTLFGGKYPNRGVFLDLSAGPINYNENDLTEDYEGVSADSIWPIWTYDFQTELILFNANLTEYIQETIDLVFSPSYLYTPTVQDQYDLNVYILDNTSTGDVYTNTLNYIDPTTIDNAFEALIPYSDWNTSYYVNYLSNYPDLQQLIKNAYDSTDKIDNPNAIYPYDKIIDYLNENRSLFGMTDNSIPVFIFAWDEFLYFGSEFVVGRAEKDENGNPLLVLGGYNPSYLPNSGYTTLIIHEVGHILGLRHPHDGWSWNKLNNLGYGEFVDWIRDFIRTPMTYAHNADVFSTFDYDSLDRGHVIQRTNDTRYSLYKANKTLLDNGYITLDSFLNETLNRSIYYSNIALGFFSNLSYFDSFYYANLSYVEANAYLAYAISLPNILPYLITPTNLITITNSTILLEWRLVSSALEYRILLSDNPDLIYPIVNDTTTLTEYLLMDLQTGIYYWSIQANTSFGWGRVTDTWTFIINLPIPSSSSISLTSDSISTTTNSSNGPSSTQVESSDSKSFSKGVSSSSPIPISSPSFTIISIFVLIGFIIVKRYKKLN